MSNPSDESAFVGDLIDAFAARAHKRSVAAEEDGDADVTSLEAELGFPFPPTLRAYLLARLHHFDQLHSRRHQQLVFMVHTPAREPLRPFRRLLANWGALISANYLPIGECGDGWGPLCLDGKRRAPDADCPLVWFDHEILARLGEGELGRRNSVEPHAKDLYASYRVFIADVFTPP